MPDSLDNSWLEQAAKSGELAALLVPRRPTPSIKRAGSYYQAHFAECIMPVLDAMLEDGKDRIFFWKQFPQYSKTSLRLRVNQAWLYAIDNRDTPDRKYFRLRENIIIRATDAGLKLIHKHREKPEVLMPDIAIEEEKSLGWRDELNQWLVGGEAGTKFERTGLTLTEDEVGDVKISLRGLDNIVSSITAKKIKCLKLTDDEVEKLRTEQNPV